MGIVEDSYDEPTNESTLNENQRSALKDVRKKDKKRHSLSTKESRKVH